MQQPIHNMICFYTKINSRKNEETYLNDLSEDNDDSDDDDIFGDGVNIDKKKDNDGQGNFNQNQYSNPFGNPQNNMNQQNNNFNTGYSNPFGNQNNFNNNNNNMNNNYNNPMMNQQRPPQQQQPPQQHKPPQQQYQPQQYQQNNYNPQPQYQNNQGTNKARKSKVFPSKTDPNKRLFKGKYELDATIPVKYNTVDYFMLVENVRINNEVALREMKRGKASDILNMVLDSLEFLSYIHK